MNRRRILAGAGLGLAALALPAADRAANALAPLAEGLPAQCLNGDPAPWRFMFMGDSLTDGVGQKPYWSWLLPRMPTVPRVSVGSRSNAWGVHEGIPGQTAGQLLPRIPGLMGNYSPHVVVLCIGTNLDGDGVTTVGRVADCVDAILAADPCVRLAVCTTAYSFDQRRSADAQFVNAAIPGLVEQRDGTGSRIRWVDLTSVPLSLTIDKLHWSADGADLVSWLVMKEIQHFVGFTIGGDRWLPITAVNLAQYPPRTGTSLRG